MRTRLFRLVGDRSDKFWQVSVDGTSLVVQYGRCGTVGQVKTKEYGRSWEARDVEEVLIHSKTRKGYVEQKFGDFR